jgi:hypothetical protein
MRVVGRSGVVQDLPDRLAKSLIRDGTVERVKDEPKKADKPSAEPAEATAEQPKPQRTRKPKTEE